VSVIAFRPRRDHTDHGHGIPLSGDLRAPDGGPGKMLGHFRVQRLVLAPRGAFVTGVVTGELCDSDGSPVGVASRRVTAPADLVPGAEGLQPVVRSLQLDLMGITVTIPAFPIDPAMVLSPGRTGRP